MKISIVNGNEPLVKYISVGNKKVVQVADYSKVREEPRHHLQWDVDITLEQGLPLIKKLFDEARYYQRLPEDRVAGFQPWRIVALGKKVTAKRFGLHPINNFWEHENPISQVQENDVNIGLLTPYYIVHLSNCSDKNLRQGIDHAQVTAYSNISSSLADFMAATLPAFTGQKETARTILTYYLDQILAPYQKPVKVN